MAKNTTPWTKQPGATLPENTNEATQYFNNDLTITGVPGTPAFSSIPLGRNSTSTGLNILSSFDGGEDNGGVNSFDSTGRLNLYSYQRAQANSYGETIRHFLMKSDAKAMIAWYMPKDQYDDNEDPDETRGWTPIWWIGAHWEANDNASIHGHGSIEVPDSTGALQTRLEVPFVDQENPPASGETVGVDITNIATNMADFTVRFNTGGVFRLGGNNSVNKDIVFSTSATRNASYVRWKVRTDNSTESGSNVGSDFLFNSYSDNGTYIDTPLKIQRSTGKITIKGDLELSGAPSDILHTAELDVFPQSQTTYGFRFDVLTNVPTLSALGSSTLAIADSVDVTGTLQADGLRLDVAPVSETPSATHTVTVNLNGTNYKLLCVAA